MGTRTQQSSSFLSRGQLDHILVGLNLLWGSIRHSIFIKGFRLNDVKKPALVPT